MTKGLRYLARRDRDLAQIYERWGVPPMWPRAEGFASLVHTILEQQVSLASALAAFERLTAAAAPLSPERFLEFDDDALRKHRFQSAEGGVRAAASAGGDRGQARSRGAQADG